MPLDNLFHKRTEQLAIETIKVFWKRCAVIMFLIVWLIIVSITYYVGSSIEIWDVIIGILVPFYLSSFLAFLVAKLSTYRGLSEVERGFIYFYMIMAIGHFLWLLGQIDHIFYDSVVQNWLDSFFHWIGLNLLPNF